MLFRKKGRPSGGGTLRLFYASDIHGTEVLWRKFLHAPRVYEATVLVMGGDVTGKVVVPIVRNGDGYHAELFGEEQRVRTAEELEALQERVRSNGMYPSVMGQEDFARVAAMSEAEREEWFARIALESLERWLELADERLEESGARCFVMGGNDDPPDIDDFIGRAATVEACDGRVVEFDGYTMISVGYSNRTPFDSPRELDEDELLRRIDTLAAEAGDMDRCIFNLHVPPYASDLDTAAELTSDLELVTEGGQPKLIPVGSTAVREAIEKHQPLLALHGHVHESRGSTKIGRTVCVNPGSDYHTGRISGCLLNLSGTRVTHQLMNG
jgi:Icc-related predicted phosphoesterase